MVVACLVAGALLGVFGCQVSADWHERRRARRAPMCNFCYQRPAIMGLLADLMAHGVTVRTWGAPVACFECAKDADVRAYAMAPPHLANSESWTRT